MGQDWLASLVGLWQGQRLAPLFLSLEPGLQGVHLELWLGVFWVCSEEYSLT